MGYERNDRRYGREGDYRTSGYSRDYGARDYGRDRDYRYDDRGFFDRAGDEVRSWFGDEDAERRRRLDERYDERDGDRSDYRDRGGYDRAPRSSSAGGYGSGGRFADPARYGGGSAGSAGGGRFGAGDSRAEWWRGEDHFQGQDRWQGQDRSSDFARYSDRDREANRVNFGGHPGSDSHYRSWRDRQVEALDRDYDEYRREHQSKFESEFGNWRRNRETQRNSLNEVREHQDVVGSDGSHVGTVDKVRDDRIILTKNDQEAGGHHHSIPSSWIASVSADRVTLGKTAEEAKKAWKDEERNSALFGGERDRDGRDRDGGARNLNRSFSGTY
jgi:hypothetical protein